MVKRRKIILGPVPCAACRVPVAWATFDGWPRAWREKDGRLHECSRQAA